MTSLPGAIGLALAFAVACGGGPGSDVGLGTGGAAGRIARGTGGAGGASSVETAVGASCASDADCGKGSLMCLLPTSSDVGGGPAGGVCTLDCSKALTDPKVNVCVPGSVCVKFTSTTAYCLEGCALGAAPSGQKKCHGRVDMACTDSESPEPYCNPTCRGDFDCGDRRCDFSSGRCVDKVSGTLAPGNACEEDSADNACRAGICLGTPGVDGGPSAAFCSGLCRLGGLGCGEDPSTSEPRKAMCLLLPQGSKRSAGDTGYCASLCDCNDDCKSPNLVCDPLPDDYQSVTGRLGSCSPIGPDLASRDGLPCGSADAGVPPSDAAP